MKILQVVGYKDSGKTTTTVKLIEFLSKEGIKVGSLKHHGHGGVPLGIDSTDSFRHRQAGAEIASVEGEGMLQIIQQGSWEIEQLVSMYEWLGIEVLVIEGYKKADYPKIVVVNRKEDLFLLEETTNILAVVTEISLEGKDIQHPIFRPAELSALCDWIFKNRVMGKR